MLTQEIHILLTHTWPIRYTFDSREICSGRSDSEVHQTHPLVAQFRWRGKDVLDTVYSMSFRQYSMSGSLIPTSRRTANSATTSGHWGQPWALFCKDKMKRKEKTAIDSGIRNIRRSYGRRKEPKTPAVHAGV